MKEGLGVKWEKGRGDWASYEYIRKQSIWLLFVVKLALVECTRVNFVYFCNNTVNKPEEVKTQSFLSTSYEPVKCESLISSLIHKMS